MNEIPEGTRFAMAVPAVVQSADPPRIVLDGGLWKEMDLQVCVHGEKLRWTCDLCAEFFETAKALSGILKK